MFCEDGIFICVNICAPEAFFSFCRSLWEFSSSNKGDVVRLLVVGCSFLSTVSGE